MSKLDVIRAWKDEAYRATLMDPELAVLPAHPSGAVELPLDDLALAGANEMSLWGGMCTCIGICPFTADLMCGTINLLCTLVVCPPWIL